MTITNGYCTLAEVYNRIPLVINDDATRDAYVEQMIEAASRWIDNKTGRRFYATTATRYFTAESAYVVRVPDLLSITTLKTDEDGDRTYETTWETTDYDLMPYNYTPYQWLEVTPNGTRTFTLFRRGVEIAGSWGYTSTPPDAINEACILLSTRLFKRKDAVFGVMGSTSLGQTTMQIPDDPDAMDLIRVYIKGALL